MKKNIAIILLIICLLSMLFKVYKYEVAVRDYRMTMLKIAGRNFMYLATVLGANGLRDFNDIYYTFEASESLEHKFLISFLALKKLPQENDAREKIDSCMLLLDKKFSEALSKKDDKAMAELGEIFLLAGKMLVNVQNDNKRAEPVLFNVDFHYGEVFDQDLIELVDTINEKVTSLE